MKVYNTITIALTILFASCTGQNFVKRKISSLEDADDFTNGEIFEFLATDIGLYNHGHDLNNEKRPCSLELFSNSSGHLNASFMTSDGTSTVDETSGVKYPEDVRFANFLAVDYRDVQVDVGSDHITISSASKTMFSATETIVIKYKKAPFIKENIKSINISNNKVFNRENITCIF